MSSKFPATSIGRGVGRQLSSTPDSDSAHPLLSASSAAYVPYTPRQRVATTGTTLSSAAADQGKQEGHGATDKLQMMHLKSALQDASVDPGSVGWAMVERLMDVGPGEEEWKDIWLALGENKSTILLPIESYDDKETITPDFVKDHIVLCECSSIKKDTPIITLSGLRGTLDDSSTLTIQSSLHHSSPHFQAILNYAIRNGALTEIPPLSTLPTLASPLPSPSSPTHPPATSLSPAFPSYHIQSLSSPLSLSLPASSTSSPASPSRKPPLPPRPTNQSRISNPFASIFSKSSPSPSHSPAPSISSLEDVAATAPVVISALTIDKRLVFDDIATTVLSALHSTGNLIEAPPWVVEKVQVSSESFLPFVEIQNSEKKKDRDRRKWAVQEIEYSADVLGEMVQDFYAGIEEEMDERIRARKERSDDASGENYDYAKIMIMIEKSFCALFYDRLFRPPESADAHHDEALASRVAALNVLDLTLEHLDLVFEGEQGKDNVELERIVKSCGECLSRLQTVYTPSDKAQLMIECHKIVVDGLAKLPLIRLRKEGEPIGGEKKKSEAEAKAEANSDAPADTMITDTVPTSEPGETSRSPSPSPPVGNTEVSLDVLFPLLIFSVVRANPPRLVSHVLFTQRFLPPVIGDGDEGGEARYCLVNLLAVVEFLENVDVGTLGLGTNGIPLPLVNITSSSPSPPRSRAASISSTVSAAALRDQVDALAGSANKVLSGSFGMLRSFLPAVPGSVPPADGAESRPAFGMLRRDSVFSIKSILPGAKAEAADGEELRPVSRATSRTGRGSDEEGYGTSDDEEEEEESEDGEDGEEDEEEYESDEQSRGRDTRSIRSFESMMKKNTKKNRGRKSLSDRLSGITGKATKKSSAPQKSKPLLLPRVDSPSPPPTARARLAPPAKRFMECASDGSDLRISEVAELVKDYRRMADGLRAAGAFD